MELSLFTENKKIKHFTLDDTMLEYRFGYGEVNLDSCMCTNSSELFQHCADEYKRSGGFRGITKLSGVLLNVNSKDYVRHSLLAENERLYAYHISGKDNLKEVSILENGYTTLGEGLYCYYTIQQLPTNTFFVYQIDITDVQHLVILDSEDDKSGEVFLPNEIISELKQKLIFRKLTKVECKEISQVYPSYLQPCLKTLKEANLSIPAQLLHMVL